MENDFIVDLKYKTTDNFMKKQLYDDDLICICRYGTYKKLLKAKVEANKLGYDLKIWDAYRPYEIQQQMWDEIHDPKFVSDPANGTLHPKGKAIDLTLVNFKTGEELSMPTEFDDFTEKAHRSNYNLSDTEAASRALILEAIMKYAGFKGLETEWWHFNDIDDYPEVK